MAINTHGGGARTNESGLRFEQDTSLEKALTQAGYAVLPDGKVVTDSGVIAITVGKHKLYKRLLEPAGVKWQDYISKQLLPDEALYVFNSNTLFIIEKKFQHDSGSVDEKLQTCDFKKKQYQKLFSKLGYAIEYLYVCNDWFARPEYLDVRNYIVSVGCHIYFNEIPLEFFCLPPVTPEV